VGKFTDGRSEGGQHVGVLAGDHMPSGFEAVAATGAVVIVPFPMLQHHMLNSGMPTGKLGYPEAV